MSLAARLMEWLVAPLLSIWLVSLGISLMSARNTVATILDDGLSSAAMVLVAEWQARMPGDVKTKFPSAAIRQWLNIVPETPIACLIVDHANVPQSGDPDLLQLLRETTDPDRQFPTATAAHSHGLTGFNIGPADASLRVVRTKFSVAGRKFVVGVVQSRERHAALFRVGTMHEITAQSATLLVRFFCFGTA